MVIILPLIAILAVTSEWSQRTGLTTFTLVPHRGRIIAAKAISSVVDRDRRDGDDVRGRGARQRVGRRRHGRPLVWDVTVTQCLYYVLGMVLAC